MYTSYLCVDQIGYGYGKEIIMILKQVAMDKKITRIFVNADLQTIPFWVKQKFRKETSRTSLEQDGIFIERQMNGTLMSTILDNCYEDQLVKFQVPDHVPYSPEGD